MSTRNYLVLSEDLSITDRMGYRLKAMAAGIATCFENNIGTWNPKEMPAANGIKPSMADALNFLKSSGGEPPDSLDIREFQPVLEAGAALDQWNTAPLLVVGNEYSVFQAIPAPVIGLRAKKLIVWYRVQCDTVPMPVSRLLFRRTTAVGITTAQYDMEQLATGEKLDGYLSSPQIWLPNMPYAINVMARIATLVFARIIMGNFVFEPAGGTNA